MKKFQALLVALAGAAAAIPGIAATKDFIFPAGTGPLFHFALATFSSAVVLLGYVARKDIQRVPRLVAAAIGAAGMLIVLAIFVANTWLTTVVMVDHSYDDSGPKFFPLFLSAGHQKMVDSVGGRRKLIEKRTLGPGIVTVMTTERNTALTLGVLLFSYTALIGSAALLFAFLGFHATGSADADDMATSTPPAIGAAKSGAAQAAPPTGTAAEGLVADERGAVFDEREVAAIAGKLPD